MLHIIRLHKHRFLK